MNISKNIPYTYPNTQDIKNKSIEELIVLCQDIRERILEVVSKNGGHLSSTLGATELIVAMHHVFDSLHNPFIFDVSHQAYAHKLLTGRWKDFEGLRQTNGISGFIKPSESLHDYFIAGHSSTSISLAVGAAKSIFIKKEHKIPIVLIGDGALSAGLCYEALNELGDRKYPLIIILNDNEMSIAEPIGAISKYLSQAIAGNFFQTVKSKLEPLFKKLPDGATYLAKRFEESLKLITPGLIFEELGLEYIGPIDGHNLKEIIESLHIAKNLKKPIVIHAQTIKGKGYEIAEGQHEIWHGVSPFDINSGKALHSTQHISPTKAFSDTLYNLAQKDEHIVGITAAMPSGTGLDTLIKAFPHRFWDVAIAEAHGVTSMAAAAKEKLKPFVVIYSTFLQRAFDQIIHDVGIMSLPVRFAIDRAGIVGEDGETHQGVFDVAFLRIVPNFTLMAPYCNAMLSCMTVFASNFNEGPIAFRYPRKSFILSDDVFNPTPIVYGKGEILLEGNTNKVLIGYGNGVGRGYKVIQALKEKGEDIPALVDLRFLKPLDCALLESLINKNYTKWFVLSDNSCVGGVASALLEWQMHTPEAQNIHITSLEFPDVFIPHGKTEEIEYLLNIDIFSLMNKILE